MINDLNPSTHWEDQSVSPVNDFTVLFGISYFNLTMSSSIPSLSIDTLLNLFRTVLFPQFPNPLSIAHLSTFSSFPSHVSHVPLCVVTFFCVFKSSPLRPFWFSSLSDCSMCFPLFLSCVVSSFAPCAASVSLYKACFKSIPFSRLSILGFLLCPCPCFKSQIFVLNLFCYSRGMLQCVCTWII